VPYHTGKGNTSSGRSKAGVSTGESRGNKTRRSEQGKRPSTPSPGEERIPGLVDPRTPPDKNQRQERKRRGLNLARNSIVNTRLPNVYIRENVLNVGSLTLSMSIKGAGQTGKDSLADFVTTAVNNKVKIILSFDENVTRNIISKKIPLTYDFNQVDGAAEMIFTGANLQFTTLDDLYRTIDRNLNEYIEIPFEVTFRDSRLTMENPEHLTCIAFSYNRNLNEPIGSAKAYSNVGKMTVDSIFENYTIIDKKIILKRGDNAIWAGEYYKNSKGKLQTGSPGLARSRELKANAVANLKIKDQRVFQKLRGELNEEIPSINPDEVVDPNVNLRTAEFSNLYTSLDKDRNVNLLFGIDCREIFLKNAKLKKIISDDELLQQFMLSMTIKSIKIFRKEVETNDRLKQSPLLLVSSQDDIGSRILKEVSGEETPVKSSIVEVFLDGKMERGSLPYRLRYFSITDLDIAKETNGSYQYEVEIEFEEGTENYLRQTNQELKNTVEAIREVRQNSGRFFNHKSKRFEQAYVSSNSENLQQTILGAIKVYLRGLSMVTELNKSTKKGIARTLMNMVHPANGSLEGMNTFIALIEGLILFIKNNIEQSNVLTKGKKDPDSQATSLKQSTTEGSNIVVRKIYSNPKDIYNVNCINSTGKEYLGSQSEEVEAKGMKAVTSDAFEARINKEKVKFPGSDVPEEIISQKKGDTFNFEPEVNEFSFVTPEYVQVGDNVVDLADTSTKQHAYTAVDTLLTVRSNTREYSTKDEKYYENVSDTEEKTLDVVQDYVSTRSAEMLTEEDLRMFLGEGEISQDSEEDYESNKYVGDQLNFESTERDKGKFAEETTPRQTATRRAAATSATIALEIITNEKAEGAKRKDKQTEHGVTTKKTTSVSNDALNIEKEGNIIDNLNVEQLKGIPNQIMGLVKNPPENFKSPNPGNTQIDQLNFGEFKLKYGSIQSIEILTGFGVSITDEVWQPLTKKLFNKIGSAALMRMRPYTNSDLGIEETYSCPVFNEYFIVGEPYGRQAIGDTEMTDMTVSAPVPKNSPPEFMESLADLMQPSRVKRCRARRVPEGAEQERMMQEDSSLNGGQNNNGIINNLYTPGGEFTLPDGTEYEGFYHIHPEIGAMAGKFHTPEPHPRLTRIRLEVATREEAIDALRSGTAQMGGGKTRRSAPTTDIGKKNLEKASRQDAVDALRTGTAQMGGGKTPTKNTGTSSGMQGKGGY